MQPLLRELAQILGSDNFFTDSASCAVYGSQAHYAPSQQSVPVAVCAPTLPAQAAAILKTCSKAKIPVRIRGLGTFPEGQTYPHDYLLLLTTGLGRIQAIDADNRIAHVQAGVKISDLANACKRKNLYCPAFPAWAGGTVGGSLAVNSVHCAKISPPASYCLELECCAANGSEIVCANQTYLPGHVMAGYALAPIFCGSFGSLGLITSAKLRLAPLPESKARICFSFASEQALGSACSTLIKAGLEPDSLFFLNPECAAAFLPKNAWPDWLLSAAFSGPTQTTEEAIFRCNAICVEHGATLLETELPTLKRLWPALAGRFPFRLLKLGCQVADLSRFLGRISELTEGLTPGIAGFGDLARVSVAIPVAKASSALLKELFALELMANSLLRSEADAELGRQGWQERYRADADLTSHIRNLLDPAGILTLNSLPGEYA